MELTPSQKRMIEHLKSAYRIEKGQRWHARVPRKGRLRFEYLDGRVCNALERLGILVYDDRKDVYTLNLPKEQSNEH